MNLAKKANAIEPRIATSSWPDHEHVRGYAVMELPFSSGDLLGLRVWPQTDFAPWVSVWHRTPEGAWSMYNDGHSLETTCPRYWGPALRRADLADVDLEWVGQNDLRVTMADPRLEWTMSMRAPPLLRGLNAVNAALPRWTWKPAALRRVREWMADRLLGLGPIRLSFTTPSGHEAVVMPEQLYYVDDATAVLDGRSLGEPVRLDRNPTIGGVPTPTRPVFALGQAHLRITDAEEYRRTRRRVHAGADAGGTAP